MRQIEEKLDQGAATICLVLRPYRLVLQGPERSDLVSLTIIVPASAAAMASTVNSNAPTLVHSRIIILS